MGKVKAWLMDMEAEAVGMTKKEFIKQYGKSRGRIFGFSKIS